MNTVVGNEAFLASYGEERSMADSSSPRIQVRIEMYHRNRTIGLVECTKDGKRNGVIATHTEGTKYQTAPKRGRSAPYLTILGCSRPSFASNAPGFHADVFDEMGRARRVKYATSI